MILYFARLCFMPHHCKRPRINLPREFFLSHQQDSGDAVRKVVHFWLTVLFCFCTWNGDKVEVSACGLLPMNQ